MGCLRDFTFGQDLTKPSAVASLKHEPYERVGCLGVSLSLLKAPSLLGFLARWIVCKQDRSRLFLIECHHQLELFLVVRKPRKTEALISVNVINNCGKLLTKQVNYFRAPMHLDSMQLFKIEV